MSGWQAKDNLAGTKQPQATGSDGRIPDSLAQEDTYPFHIIRNLNEIAAKNKCVEQGFFWVKEKNQKPFMLTGYPCV